MPITSGQLELDDAGSDGSGDDEVVEEKMDVDDEETQSHHTSSREDSHSPISFFEKDEPKKPASSTPDGSEDEDEDEDEEMPDVENVDAKPEVVNSKTTERSKLDQMSLYSSDAESEDEEETKPATRVPKSSPPVPAARTPETKTSITKLKNSKEFSRTDRSNTQDQVDHQLTSSMYEVRSSQSNTPTPKPPASTQARPPSIRFGASLTNLHQKRLSLGGSSQIKTPIGRTGQLQSKLSQTGDDEDSESSDEDSDADSSDGDIPAKAPAATQAGVAGSWASSALQPTKPKDKDSNDDDESDNDSPDDSADEKDEEAQRSRAGDELAAQVAALQSSPYSNKRTLSSPKKFIFGTQQERTPKAKVKTYGVKRDKYTYGHSFSQPK